MAILMLRAVALVRRLAVLAVVVWRRAVLAMALGWQRRTRPARVRITATATAAAHGAILIIIIIVVVVVAHCDCLIGVEWFDWVGLLVDGYLSSGSIDQIGVRAPLLGIRVRVIDRRL